MLTENKQAKKLHVEKESRNKMDNAWTESIWNGIKKSTKY